MARHQRDRLGDIERRAAAQADHRIGVVRLVRGRALLHLAADGIAPDLGENADIETRQRRDEVREQRQRRDPAVGDDERPLDALGLEMVRDELAGAGSEVDGGREAESCDGHGCARKWIMWFLS